MISAFLVNDDSFRIGGLVSGSTYTVRVTENSTGCSRLKEATLGEGSSAASLTPRLSELVVTDILSCDPGVLTTIDASRILPNTDAISVGNLNVSFEDFDILSANNQVQVFVDGTIKNFNQEDINGWSTTATDQLIELWHNSNPVNGSTHDAFHGNQFAEINANVTAALYFDLATIPEALFNWSFAHKGRDGTDVISVNIGEPGSEISQGTFSTGNTAWKIYEGTYLIPEGQNLTRFQFEAVSTATGDQSIGNFVDTISFVLFPYRFELYRGTSTSGTPDFSNTSGIFKDLNDGDYTLVIYDNLTGCEGAIIPITIERLDGSPVLAISSIIHDDNCDTGTGTVTATSSTVQGEPSSYTYQLFDGHSFATQIGPDVTITDGPTGNVFTSLEFGDYRVNVINGDLLCNSFEDIVVNDVTITPTFSSTRTVNDNTSCDPMNTNGFLSVSINGGGAATNYDFSWYDGNNTGAPELAGGVGVQSQSGLDAGFYTVVAEHNTTGCETVPLTFEINDRPFIPNVIFTEEALQTYCESGNGELSATIDNNPDLPPGAAPSTVGFSFQWQLDGTNLQDGVEAANGSVPSGSQIPNVSGLIADEYTLAVTHDRTNCQATESFILNESIDYPVLSEDLNIPNTTCDPTAYNGSITVKVALGTDPEVADLSAYEFTWYNGSGAAKTLNTSSTNQTLSGIDEGEYSVTVQAPNNCTSDTVVFNITDNLPVISPVPTNLGNNTVCDPDNNGPPFPDSNGTITFTPGSTSGNPTDGYRFALTTSTGTAIDNTGVTPGFTDVRYNITAAATTPVPVTGLSADNYIMTIFNEDNECFVEHPFSIGDEFTRPSIDPALIVITPNSTCDNDNFNGRADASPAGVVSDGSGNYRFEWTTATAPTTVIDDDNILDNDAGTGIGVEDGIYILTVIDDETGCVSVAVNVTIGDGRPPIMLTPTILSDNFSCDIANPNGSAKVSVTGGNIGHTFEWHVGTSAFGPIIDADSLIKDQLHGTYTVKVTNNTTTCFETAQVTISEFTPTLTITTVGTGQNTCPPNGSAEVTETITFDPPAPPPIGFTAPGTFTYEWYFGAGTTTLLEEGIDPGNGSSPTDVNTGTVTGLAPGQYSVVATDRQTGCVSNLEIEEIDDLVTSNAPTIVFNNDLIPSNCAAENGRITATIQALNGLGNDFMFEWFEGAQGFAGMYSTGSGNELNNGDLLVANPTGNTVIITQTPGGVGATATLDRVVSGLYTLVMIDRNSGCRYQLLHELGFNGQQTTTTLTTEHVDECADNGVARVGLSDNLIIDVTVTAGVEFTIKEEYTTPGGAMGVINAVNATGTELQLSVTAGTLAVGADITGNSSGTTATIDAVRSDGYTAGEVDDITQYILYLYAGNGVPADRSMPFTHGGVVFPLRYTASTGNIQDGNGDLLPVPGGMPGMGAILTPGESAEFPGLPAGPYIAIAREIPNPAFNPMSTDQCWTEASTDEEIFDLAHDPIIVNSTNTPNTNCDVVGPPANGNGQLSITVRENPAENLNPAPLQQPDGYRFTWTEGTAGARGTTVHTEDLMNETETSTTMPNLVPGNYTVAIQRLGGCYGRNAYRL